MFFCSHFQSANGKGANGNRLEEKRERECGETGNGSVDETEWTEGEEEGESDWWLSGTGEGEKRNGEEGNDGTERGTERNAGDEEKTGRPWKTERRGENGGDHGEHGGDHGEHGGGRRTNRRPGKTGEGGVESERRTDETQRREGETEGTERREGGRGGDREREREGEGETLEERREDGEEEGRRERERVICLWVCGVGGVCG